MENQVGLRSGKDIADDLRRATGEDVKYNELLARRDSTTLDPNHPFEAVLLEMAALSRRKRADYAVDGSPFSNFYETAAEMRRAGIVGFTALDSVAFNRAQKTVRLRALKTNGRLDQTANESVRDSLLDDAVYAAIALAIYDEGGAKVPGEDA